MLNLISNERFRKLLLAVPAKAIRLLYDYYYELLLDVAIALVHDRKVAEDVVQETFIHVWEQRRKLGQPDNRPIKHYLVKVVKNKAISRYKDSLKRYPADKIGHSLIDSQISAEQKIIGLESALELRKFILTFPPREIQCLLLRIDESLTTKQIADRLSVSIKAVERSLTSAYKRLRNFLKKRGDCDSPELWNWR